MCGIFCHPDLGRGRLSARLKRSAGPVVFRGFCSRGNVPRIAGRRALPSCSHPVALRIILRGCGATRGKARPSPGMTRPGRAHLTAAGKAQGKARPETRAPSDPTRGPAGRSQPSRAHQLLPGRGTSERRGRGASGGSLPHSWLLAREGDTALRARAMSYSPPPPSPHPSFQGTSRCDSESVRISSGFTF